MHQLTPQRLRQLLDSPEALTLSLPARERLMMIADFLESGRSISEMCDELGIARSTFHRWLERFDVNDLTTLESRPHDPYDVRTATVAPEAVSLIRGYREASPLIGKERIHDLLLSEHGIELSASTIGRVIERECLYFGATPLHIRKRMQHKHTPASSVPVAVSPAVPAPSHHDVLHSCAWCTLRGALTKRRVLRFLGVTSLLINISFAAMFIATALWEQDRSAEMSANIVSGNSVTHYNLDISSDGK